jgi:hypothetical protein
MGNSSACECLRMLRVEGFIAPRPEVKSKTFHRDNYEPVFSKAVREKLRQHFHLDYHQFRSDHAKKSMSQKQEASLAADHRNGFLSKLMLASQPPVTKRETTRPKLEAEQPPTYDGALVSMLSCGFHYNPDGL